ncbi:MAG: hypothetical protein U0Q15_20635 [Kineosporiaceae bacterium]
MEFVYDLLVIVHLIGMAAVVGSWMSVVRSPRVVPGMVHGALTQVVSGLALVGLRESGVVDDEGDLDHAKIGVKLLVALVVAGLAWVNRKRADAVPPVVVHAIGGLALLNVVIAVLWH